MKVDFVIPWVDGSDPKWQEEKNEFSSVKQSDDNQENRYRDFENLMYWFRGIEKYTPWVNKIHFITAGHVPSWLNIDHPKLNIVNHKDYMPAEYLPTFNAGPIEINIHRIPDLAEHFVYFNDDTFLIKDVSKKDFFENDLPKDVAILNPIVPKAYNSISSVMVNDISLINKNFSFRKSFKKDWKKWLSPKYKQLLPLNILFQPWSSVVGLYQQHLPNSFLKSTIEEVWKKEEYYLNDTSLRKKRDNKRDINQWIFKQWLIMDGKFMPRNINFGKYIMIKDLKDIEEFKKAKIKSDTKVVCLNDHVESNLEEIIKNITIEFEEILKEKSDFEL